MKNLITITLIAFLISIISSAQINPSDSLKINLVKIAQELLDAVAVGDTTVWKKYLLNHSSYVTEEGKLNTKSSKIQKRRC
ncbi:MAG: hypothetical protein ABI550_02025 [Ignavibacteriaceae bacterium]